MHWVNVLRAQVERAARTVAAEAAAVEREGDEEMDRAAHEAGEAFVLPCVAAPRQPRMRVCAYLCGVRRGPAAAANACVCAYFCSMRIFVFVLLFLALLPLLRLVCGYRMHCEFLCKSGTGIMCLYLVLCVSRMHICIYVASASAYS